MRKSIVLAAAIAAAVCACTASAQDPQPPAAGGPKCDLKVVQTGWFCQDCKEFKQANGDCCDPCPCKGCVDNTKVRMTHACAKDVYVCEMGCPDSTGYEPGPCPNCGGDRKREADQAEVTYTCPKCGDAQGAILKYKCPKCNAPAKSKDCETCKVKVEAYLEKPGACDKCKAEREPVCGKSGKAPHAVKAAEGEKK